MKIISASIDLNKIDRSKIIPGKNGAQYFPLSIIVKDEKDQYGNDVAVTIGQSKEERDAKAQRVYIGNGKTVFEDNTSTQNATVGFTPTHTPPSVPAGAKLSRKPTDLSNIVDDDLLF